MRAVVDKLWELQTVLTELAQKDRELNTKPESFAAVDAEYGAANSHIEELNKRLEDLARERRRIEGDLQDAQELLKKYQGQLMQVKNQQQYSAAWKEIDTSRKQVKDYEDSLLQQMTQADEIQKQLEDQRGGYDELKERYDAAHGEWQHSLGDLRAEIVALKKRIEGIEAGIPAPQLREFHKIYQQRQGVAVTRVENGACGACRVRLRPQALQQVRRGDFTICEACRRIFYAESVAS